MRQNHCIDCGVGILTCTFKEVPSSTANILIISFACLHSNHTSSCIPSPTPTLLHTMSPDSSWHAPFPNFTYTPPLHPLYKMYGYLHISTFHIHTHIQLPHIHTSPLSTPTSDSPHYTYSVDIQQWGPWAVYYQQWRLLRAQRHQTLRIWTRSPGSTALYHTDSLVPRLYSLGIMLYTSMKNVVSNHHHFSSSTHICTWCTTTYWQTDLNKGATCIYSTVCRTSDT